MTLSRLFLKKQPWRARLGLILPVSMLVAVLAVTIVGAAGHVETVVKFNPNGLEQPGKLPEGVTVDQTGNVFVSLSPLGQLVKVAPGAHMAEPFGSIPGLQAGDAGLIGLAVDAPGNVYGGVFSANPAAHGVWKFDRKTGAAARVPDTEAIQLPNDIAFDTRGHMYITDSIGGAVWRVPQGGSLEKWIVDDLLAGDSSLNFPFPIGANGLAIRHNTVYVGVSEKASIVTVPILPNGAAGEAQFYANVGTPVDGIALDVHGNVYVAAPLTNEVVRVHTGGTIEPLAAGAPLDFPTSVAFGTGKGERQSLYVVNFSIFARAPDDPNYPAPPNPALVKIAVGEPGQPQP